MGRRSGGKISPQKGIPHRCTQLVLPLRGDRSDRIRPRVPGLCGSENAKAREFVGAGKQSRVRSAASMWLAAHDIELQPRFDVIEIYGTEDMPYRKLQIRQIENAFE